MAKGPKLGLLTRAYDKLVNVILRKEVVGADNNGNTYYRYFEKVNGQQIERREVKWNTAYMMYDPNDIPSEWRMWLRKLREKPPTPEELEQSQSKAATLRERVAALEEQERLRRLRMQTQGAQAQQASAEPNMDRFLQQMGASQEGRNAPGTGSWGSYKPDSWAPSGGSPAAGQQQAGSASASGEPKGSGEGFQPGTWRPGQ